MLTKQDLLNYKKQNPSKFAHKYGHLDMDTLPEEGYVNVEKSKTELDGTPARPAIGWGDPLNGGNKLVGAHVPPHQTEPINTFPDGTLNNPQTVDDNSEVKKNESGGHGGSTLVVNENLNEHTN